MDTDCRPESEEHEGRRESFTRIARIDASYFTAEQRRDRKRDIEGQSSVLFSSDEGFGVKGTGHDCGADESQPFEGGILKHIVRESLLGSGLPSRLVILNVVPRGEEADDGANQK
jgi:hypothetical protein